MDVPDVFDDAASGTHLLFIADKVFKQGKLLGSESYFARFVEYLMGSRIDVQVTGT